MHLPDTLEDWLEYQQRQHAQPIALGLRRVRAVWQSLGAPVAAPVTITVGGTNGKGSTVAFLEAMLRARGLRVGAYTSPHLVRYNERVRVAGVEAGDAALCAAFARIEQARDAIPLTYFEYGTLAALLLFAAAGLDVALLEVGLGGRLDAVNIVDADAAIVTTIGIDHVEYLGPDRDSIGREKAGIARAGHPLVLGAAGMPAGLLDAAHAARAQVLRPGVDFGFAPGAGASVWWAGPRAPRGAHPQDAARARLRMPELALAAPHQRDNAAAALAALWALRARLGWAPEAYARGLAQARLQGRLQSLGGAPELVVDVAHNPQAAAELAAWLDAQPARPTHAVFSALADKDIAGIGAALGVRIAHWHVCPIKDAGPRGLSAAEVSQRLRGALRGAGLSEHASLHAALAAARAMLPADARILAFGSFHIAGALLDPAARG